ncbi:hypothetical protein ABK040_004281 [Willaertia magna]
MQLIELPLEIIFEIVGYVPVQELFNFLLTSKEYYQFTEYDIFWKSLLKIYLLDEIRTCKEWLNDLILNKDSLQQFFKIYSIENKGNTKKKKINLNQLNKNELLAITINIKFLQNFIEFYKHNIVQLNSLNRNSFKRFLLEDLQQFNEHNKDYNKDYNNEEEDNNIDVNEVIFSKRFKHLLQQCIKSKWSILFNNITITKRDNDFYYIFLELFLFENNNISLINIEKYLQKYKLSNEEYNLKKNNLNFLLHLFTHVRNNLHFKNIIYLSFYPKIETFINNTVWAISNNNFNEEFKIKTLEKLYVLYNAYNLKISLSTLRNIFYNNLHKISQNFIDFCLQNLSGNLISDDNDYDYQYVSEIINWLMEDYNENDNDEYCKKFNQLLNYFFTTNCDKQKLINSLSYIITNNLNTLLINSEDKSKEIFNLFESLQFFKYNFTMSIQYNFFILTYNFKNFLYLINLNVISQEGLLHIFHNNLLKNGFTFLNNETEETDNDEMKEFLIQQLKAYLNFFINDLKLNIYEKDYRKNNIIYSAITCCANFSAIIKIIKECCNLQQIDYNKIDKINTPSLEFSITRQLVGNKSDNFLYNLQSLEQIKLETIKEILTFKDIHHVYFFDLAYGYNHYEYRFYNFENYTLLALKYIISNVKMAFNENITLQEYIKEMLEREDELVLDNLIITQRDNIVNGYNDKTIDTNSDTFIYFIYKNIKNRIDELENNN